MTSTPMNAKQIAQGEGDLFLDGEEIKKEE